ncbi:hypothetical protein MACK_004005 [Theileria orientalis]|uniref:Uncharacterized protein n=1 Tax=Theileria orientalis TaxID=68886 RepID=A0A976SJY3_THEOR|nr:hypothetical protein MACK_004005 [Theileria orientalis]
MYVCYVYIEAYTLIVKPLIYILVNNTNNTTHNGHSLINPQSVATHILWC